MRANERQRKAFEVPDVFLDVLVKDQRKEEDLVAGPGQGRTA